MSTASRQRCEALTSPTWRSKTPASVRLESAAENGAAATEEASGRPSEGFEGALRGAIQIARLSPSSHNSQPWSVALLESAAARRSIEPIVDDVRADEVYFALGIDRDRIIDTLPAHAVEMLVSVGILLEGLTIALSGRGYTARVKWCRDDASQVDIADWPSTWTPVVIVAATVTDSPDSIAHHDATIEARVTNRAPYKPQDVSPEDRDALVSFKSSVAVPSASPISVEVIDDAQRIGAMADFVAKNAAIDFSHHEAWAETYRYIRWNAEQTAAAVDGFSIEQLFGPLSGFKRQFFKTVLSPTVMRMLGFTPVPIALARGLADLVRQHTRAVAVFAYPDEDAAARDQVAGGAQVMATWLEATRRGLAFHPVSVVLQHAEIRHRFQDQCGLSGRVFFFTRVGHPLATFPRTPRRDLVADGFVKI